MKIALIGTGAIGGLYGGKLNQAGASVHVLARSNSDSIKKNGIQIKSVWGDFHFQPTSVANTMTQLPKESDYLMVCTKVLASTTKLIQDIAPLIGKNTSIFLIQNGIDIEMPWQIAYPNTEIISGLAFVCCQRTSPGQVHHMDFGRLVIGGYPNQPSEKAESLSRLFNQAGVPCQVSQNIAEARWKKLIWNTPFNPLSVIYQKNTCQLLENPEIETRIRKIMREVQQIAKTNGYSISDEFIEKNIMDTKAMVTYKPSMLLDFENYREMEIEAILGNLIKLADKSNVFIPEIKTTYQNINNLIDHQKENNIQCER